MTDCKGVRLGWQQKMNPPGTHTLIKVTSVKTSPIVVKYTQNEKLLHTPCFSLRAARTKQLRSVLLLTP